MSDTPMNAYRRQLTEWAEAMIQGRNEAVYPALAAGSLPGQVDLFTEGNLGKRLDKLQMQLEFVAGAFADFEELLNAYVAAQPLAAYDAGSSDGEGFLRWLERQRRLTAEQRDYVACQRARHAVEEAGRRNRLRHVRFQELWSVADRLGEDLGANPDLRVHLNPLRSWACFHTPALLEGEGAAPADVVFFAVRDAIHTAVVEPRIRAWINGLARFTPCTVEQWLWVSKHSGRDEFIQVCRDLAEIGLVAFD